MTPDGRQSGKFEDEDDKACTMKVNRRGVVTLHEGGAQGPRGPLPGPKVFYVMCSGK